MMMITSRRLRRLLFAVAVAALITFFGTQLEVEEVSTASQTMSEKQRVARVIDGDTLELEGGEKVRLIGIDAPELAHFGDAVEPYGEAAKQHLGELLSDTPIRLEKDVSERDKYQRLLRYIFVGEVNISIQMVRDGYARSSTYPPDVKYQEEIRLAEQEAREAKRGLWQ